MILPSSDFFSNLLDIRNSTIHSFQLRWKSITSPQSSSLKHESGHGKSHWCTFEGRQIGFPANFNVVFLHWKKLIWSFVHLKKYIVIFGMAVQSSQVNIPKISFITGSCNSPFIHMDYCKDFDFFPPISRSIFEQIVAQKKSWQSYECSLCLAHARFSI